MSNVLITNGAWQCERQSTNLQFTFTLQHKSGFVKLEGSYSEICRSLDDLRNGGMISPEASMHAFNTLDRAATVD